MFCSKCGKQINDGSAFCSSCGFSLQGKPAASNQPSGPSPNYARIKEAHDHSKTTKVLGIIAAILSFGIGIFFSIAVWVRCSGGGLLIKPPNASQEERYLIKSTEKNYKVAKTLARLPLAAIGICILIVGIGIAF